MTVRASRVGPALLLAACALYLGFRALVLARAFDAVALPTYELHNMGNLARLLSLGVAHVPLWMHFDNAGGQQLTALLAAPLYALFGDGYVVLKLVPLLLGLGALLLLWHILRREFGLLAAAVGAALFVLGPPTLVKYSLLASGNHFEGVIFMLALYALAAGGHRSGWTRRRLVLTGVVAGFAVFVYPGSVVPVGVFALLHLLVRGARRALRDLPLAGLGVLLGLLPLIVVNVASGGRTLRFAGRNLAATSEPLLERFAHNAGRILGELLPRAGCFEPLGSLRGDVAESLYLLGFVSAWLLLAAPTLAGLRHLRQAPDDASRWRLLRAAPLLLFLPVLVLLVACGRWDFDAYAPPLQVGQFRYFVPHFTFAAMLAGAAVQRLSAGGRAGRIAAAALAAGLLATVAWTLPIASPWPSGSDAARLYEGHHFLYYGRILVARSPRDPDTQALVPDMQEIEDWLRDVPARHALDTWTGVAYTITMSRVPVGGADARRVADAVDLPALLAGREPAVRIALARGVGSSLRALARGDARAKETLLRVLHRLEEDRAPLAGWVAEGLCLEYEYPLSRDVGEHLMGTLAVLELPAPRWSAAVRHGFGAQLGRLLARGIAPDVRVVAAAFARLAGDERGDVARGVGWGTAEVAGAEAAVALIEQSLPEEMRDEACAGAGAARRWLDGPQPTAPPMPAGRRAAFELGAAWPNWPAPWWEE